ncbi:MAG: protein kinase domain-containing protein [Candidatus Xenobia bacterium]
MLISGDTLKGGYIIDRVLGQGGAGIVYKAVAPQYRNRGVAIKELRVPQGDPKMWVETLLRIQTEIGMLQPLRHPALAEVIECFSVGSNFYYVMELIDGRTLDDVLTETRGLPDLAAVMRWADEICDVLTYLHTRPTPILFRDLKPSNIMQDARGRIRLIDFGIARMLIEAADTDAYIKGSGTPGFAPPEQITIQGKTDARSDVFALGATIYTCLVKAAPPSITALMAGIEELMPASEQHPEVTPQMDAVLNRMMAWQKEDRYAGVAEAKVALHEALAAEPVRRLVGVAPAREGVFRAPPTRRVEEEKKLEYCPGCGAQLEHQLAYCEVCGEPLATAPPPLPMNVTSDATQIGRYGPTSPPTDDPVPASIGPYAIHGVIARGGMSTVYLAEYPGNPQRWALKRLQAMNDTESQARFQREILITLKLVHPNICQLVDWGFADNGAPYMVMELLQGEVLSAFQQRVGVLRWPDAAGWLRQLLAGLQVIHEHGVVHRDLKPANIYITSAGVLKILDFGVARRDGLKSMTAAGMMVGTIMYMAPEQMSDAHKVDVRADIFSAGLLSYVLLTGQHPYHETAIDRYISRLARGAYTPLSTVRPDLAGEVEAWVHKMMARRPEDRFPTVQAALAAMPG